MRFTVLLSVRPDSPFKAGYMESFKRLTHLSEDGVELIINETKGPLGRFGLHNYFNEILPQAKGDWIWYMCDDHEILMPGWNRYLADKIDERAADKDFAIDPKKLYVIVPRADNTGAVTHILSRGLVETLGHISMHSHVDSYLARVFDVMPGDRVMTPNDFIYTDHTVDTPAPQNQAEPGTDVVVWGDPRVQVWIQEDQDKIKAALASGL